MLIFGLCWDLFCLVAAIITFKNGNKKLGMLWFGMMVIFILITLGAIMRGE